MYPVVITDCRREDFLSALARKGNTFVVPADQESIDTSSEGDPILVGTLGGITYLLEFHGSPVAGCWGHLAGVASETSSLVVSTTYEHIGPHLELFAARGNEVLRVFWNQPQQVTRPYSVGRPLPSEAATPLTADKGAGLTAALRSFGFNLMDYAKGFERSPGDAWLGWKGDVVAIFGADPLRPLLEDHIKKHANPQYRPPVPGVKVRRM